MATNIKEARLDQFVIDRLVKTTLLKMEGKSCYDCNNCMSHYKENEVYCISNMRMIDDGHGYGSSEVCHKFEEKAKSEFSQNSLQEKLPF